jgi:Cytochrome P460
MKRIVGLVVGAAAVAGVVAYMVPASGQGGGEAAPVYGIKIPKGYRDWKVISVAQVGPPVNDIRIKLGNDKAIKAYRDSKLPFPDGAIIARLAYNQVASEENNKVFRAAAEQQGLPAEQIEKLLAASSVAGPPTNVQFMVKDSKKYAATGGWGFAQFTDGKPDGEALHKTCFSCHAPGKDRDFVFTRYSP